MNDALQSLVSGELEALGLELFELRLRGTRTRPLLDVRVDRRDGHNVTVDDCARASRAIEVRLDASEIIGDRYVLEVSSPGMERPLRHADDWRRFTGRQASVLSDALGGRAEVEIVAVGGDSGAEVATVRLPSGEERQVTLAAVREARLAFNWKR
ncbi:MAG TPA: ribosome maturation factor RimP [Gemmatimonadaceae bacterium]|nr:ribosome maturation factor RimP [Gemmatimonadaceae bacterium]